MPVIPVLRRLKQEDLEFEASLGYSAKPHLTNKRQNQSFGEVAQLISTELVCVAIFTQHCITRAWWHTPITPALGSRPSYSNKQNNNKIPSH